MSASQPQPRPPPRRLASSRGRLPVGQATRGAHLLESPLLAGTIPAMKVLRAAAMLIPALTAACGCTSAPRGLGAGPADGQELPILRQKAGTFSSIGQSLRLVIHDPGTLAMLPLDIGPVDFDKEMVLVSTMGPTPSDEYAIRIQRVWRDGPVLRAAVDVRYPPAGAALRSTPASPYHAVVVPRSPLNIRNFDVEVPPTAFARHAGGGS